MSKSIWITGLCVACSIFARAEVADAQLRDVLNRAVCFIDDPKGGPGEVSHAIRLAGGDTNRVVALMKQLIGEGPESDGVAGFYISEIGKYATDADLPFLYQQVSRANVCETAVNAIIRVEGITTGSVDRICMLLPRGDPTNRYVVSSWITLSAAVRDRCLDVSVQSMMISNAVEYASWQNVFPDRIDQSIMRLDPGYRTSRRRLGALRAITTIGVHPSRTNYVANAINELVAYPEANLPE